MKLSDVFYEAACRMSNDNDEFYSCHAVAHVTNNHPFSFHRFEYEKLMNPLVDGSRWSTIVDKTAKELGWSWRDFRTFMLLMASEAVK